MTKLSSTSALVLLWAGRDHLPGSRVDAYLKALDLDEGRALRDACDAICPYYAEVIRNRKRGVRDFIEQVISGGSVAQVIIAGAGLDPLGLDLSEAYPDLRIFEVDRDNMDLKACLARMPSISAPAFVTADLSDPEGVVAGLLAQGWDPQAPTVLVLEGITYYLTPEALSALVAAVNPVHAVVEFLKPASAIAPERVAIPERVFGLIAGNCGLPEIHRHDASGLSRHLDMRLEARRGMTELERLRTGGNAWFPAEADGWIEVCLLGAR